MEQYLTVSSKGQIVIPAGMREELGISAGTRIAVRLEGGRVILDPESLTAKLRRVEQMRGMTAGGRPGTEILLEDRQQERERELREEGW
jgi:AbrB family looped-hinge helix DNA binding protein